MKKYLLIVFLIGGMASAALAQQEHSNEHLHVPAVVKKANFEKYPDSKSYHITWEKEQGNYEANWGGKDGEANSVTYSPSGKFVEIVQAIPASQLPKAIQNYIATHFKKARIGDTGKVLDARGNNFYEVEINGKDALFDIRGNFLSKEK